MVEALSTARPEARNPAGLLSVNDLPLSDIHHVLRETASLEREAPDRRSQRLLHRRVALLFYEASTRTRTSFELAAKSLGCETTLVSAASSSIEKGESLKDTGLNLRALGCEAIILRHPNSGAAELLARATGLPVINAGDGMHEHPSQALLDLRTILFSTGLAGRKGNADITPDTLRDLTITICGDIFHSRVARSNAMLLPRLGARVLLCGPPALLPAVATELLPRDELRQRYREKPLGSLEVRHNFDACLRESNIVMMLRIQSERLANLKLDLQDYVAEFQLNEERLPLLGLDARKRLPQRIVMHPGPMVRGLELTSAVADGEASVILDQVTHGLAVRRAVLVRALSGKAAA